MKGDQQLDGAPICVEAGTLKLCSLNRRAILLGGSALAVLDDRSPISHRGGESKARLTDKPTTGRCRRKLENDQSLLGGNSVNVQRIPLLDHIELI